MAGKKLASRRTSPSGKLFYQTSVNTVLVVYIQLCVNMDAIEAIRETISSALAGDERSIFLLACVYTLVVCVYGAFYLARVSRWPSAKGKMIRDGLSHFGVTDLVKAEQEYVTDVRYEYEVNGKNYVGKRLSPWLIVASHNARFVLDMQLSRINKSTDGHVTVYYNPRNPKKSYLIRTGLLSQVVVISIGFVPAVLYFHKYY